VAAVSGRSLFTVQENPCAYADYFSIVQYFQRVNSFIRQLPKGDPIRSPFWARCVRLSPLQEYINHFSILIDSAPSDSSEIKRIAVVSMRHLCD